SFHNSGYGPELTANFINHLLSSATHCIHRHTTEHKHSHNTNKHTADYQRVHQVNLVVLYEVIEGSLSGRNIVDKSVRCIKHLDKHHPDFFKVRGQQSKSRQSSTTNCKSLTGSSCGISK